MARFKLPSVLSLVLLNFCQMILAHELISKSKLNSPDNNNGQSTREIFKVDGENVIVAEEISCWEQNGQWEKLQVCPKSKIVTAHRFRYLSRTGPTGIQLKCTQKYGDNRKKEHILVIDFEGKVENGMPRGGWENWKNGSNSAFAVGFSFDRGELSLRRSVKNYNMIYHNGNQMTVNSDSNKVVRKCPEDHAICGVTAMMDKAELGILTAIGLKCCHHCVPMETWQTIHQYNNTANSREEQKVNTTVGLQRSLQKSADYDEIPRDVVTKGFSARFGKSNSTGFDWSRTLSSLWDEETLVTVKYPCEASSSCVLKQLVGQCGSVRVPVEKFCNFSVPIGSSIPDACNLTLEETIKDQIISIPYQLSIRYYQNPHGSEWRHVCSGAILDEKTAITAAHCFDDERNFHHYRIVAGKNLLDSPDAEEQILPLKKLIIHPKYHKATDGNDIAILHVDKFQFNKNVGGVWLSPFSNEELTSKSAVISGWGDASAKSGLSNSLQKASVSILPPEDCQTRLGNQTRVQVRAGVVCALNPLIRTCVGDSGGPLVIQNYTLGNSTRNLLVGITSFGAKICTHSNRTGVFTEISSFYNWIQENRATPHGCGGFIQFRGEKEIVYKVPEELWGEKSVCVWVVTAPGASKIEAKVLSNSTAQFQPEESTLSAIYNFTRDGFNHSKIMSTADKWTSDRSFFILYFRTHSSAPNPNSGLHIRLKETGNQTFWEPVKYLEGGLKDATTFGIQEFKYPKPPATKYANDERTFIIVKPGARHGNLKLDVKSVDTEKGYDWMDILTAESGPTSYFRFSGEGSWSNKSFEAEEDEPFIIFFHSDGSNTGAGFTFSYTEQRKRPDLPQIAFYEEKDFAGSKIKMTADCSCQDIPKEWKSRVSSLRSSSCVTLFRGNKCSHWNPQYQLTGNHPDLDLDTKVSSFELCEATEERRPQQEKPVQVAVSSQRIETQFPYQLSLQMLDSHGNWNHKCGAVLLDERTALTAANCFDKTSRSSRFRLVAGMRQFHNGNETTRQILNVTKFIRHNDYKKDGVFYGYDIALLTVESSFVLNENVSPVWISSPEDPVLSDFNGTALGWGITWENLTSSSGLSNDLKVMNMPLLSYEDCKRIYSFLKDSMVCNLNGTSNTCRGDGGGPLVLRNYQFPDGGKRDLLVGISSFAARECEDLSKPNGFTKVSSFYDWITSNWKRNTTTNKFKCFNGQEIDQVWRCDEEFDCEDGSDEKGCNRKQIKDEDRPKTEGCGGEIKLVDEHDIIYRVEDSEPEKTLQCVWTIFNQRNNSIQLTLLKNNGAQFDPEQNQLIALHNFKLQNFDYKLITRICQKTRIADSYTVLIFRGPAGVQNSGPTFNLRVKSVGNSQEENPLKLKRVELKPSPTLQNPAYPPNNGFYGANERVFTVLTPSQNGSRIRLNLDIGEMEGGRDWFDVISIGQQPKSLFRFSGAKSWANNTNKNTIEGAPDETLILFMSTGSPAVKRKGIRFTYSEF